MPKIIVYDAGKSNGEFLLVTRGWGKKDRLAPVPSSERRYRKTAAQLEGVDPEAGQEEEGL